MTTILVVDDDALNLRLAVTLLEQAGYETLSAQGGAEGIQRMPTRHTRLCAGGLLPACGIQPVRQLAATLA